MSGLRIVSKGLSTGTHHSQLAMHDSWNQKCDRIRCLHSTSLQSTWKKNLISYSENPKPNSIFRNHKPYSEKAIPFYRKLQKQTTCLTTNTP